MEEEEEEQQAPGGAPGIRRYFSRSVRDVGDQLGWDQVTSWQIVHVLLRDHSHYGGSSLLPLDQNTGRIQPMDAWLEEVAEHFDLDAVTARRDPQTQEPGVVDGRMTILGLTFVDPYLASALEAAGFRQRLQDDLGPELDELLRSPDPDAAAGAERRGPRVLALHDAEVQAVAIGRLDGRDVVVSGSDDGTARVLGLDDSPIILSGHQGFVGSVAVGRFGDRDVVVTGSSDGTVRVWGGDGARLLALGPTARGVNSVAVGRLAGREVIVSGGQDGVVRSWRADDPTRESHVQHGGPVLSVAIGRLEGRDVVVSGGSNGIVRIWDEDGALVRAVESHPKAVDSVVIGLGGRDAIISGGGDGTVRIWGPEGTSPSVLQHPTGVTSVAAGLLADRAVVVSGGEDGIVRVWDADGGAFEALSGHRGAVTSVAAGRLGDHDVVVSGGADCRVRAWEYAESVSEGPAPDEAIELVGDHAATTDELGRAPIAHDLARRLERIHHDDPDHRGSFLVHLDGPWGAGKSSILNFLEQDLTSREPPWLVVWFNAWRERRVRPPWWALLTALRAAVQGELGWVGRQRLRLAETRERLSARGAAYGLGTLVFGVLVIALLIAWIVGLLPRDLGVIAGLVTGVLGAVGLLWGLSQLAGRFVFWDSARRARAFEQTEEQPMQALAQHFAWLIDAVASRRFERLPATRDPSRTRPTIFFIDDLDRCEAEQVVELMEAVQNLIRDAGSSRGPYFVVAADGRWIRRSYESWFERFQESVQERGRPLGYLFLDKLFQMSVHVPSLTGGDQDGFMGKLLRVRAGDIPAPETAVQEPPSKEEVLQRVETGAKEEDFTVAVAMAEALPAAERQEVVARVVAREAERAQAEITAHRLQPYARHLPPNPRTMKRFVNAYEIARAVDRVEGRAVSLEQRAIWTVLRLRWPSLAEELQLDPDLLDRLDDPPADPEREAMLRLLAHPDVVRLLTTAQGAPFRAADLRTCCGLEEPVTAPVGSAPPAAPA